MWKRKWNNCIYITVYLIVRFLHSICPKLEIWQLCTGFDHRGKRYDHYVNRFITKEDFRSLWYFPRPRSPTSWSDVDLENKGRCRLLIILHVPLVHESGERKKIKGTYNETWKEREIRRLCNMRDGKIMPMMIGGLGTELRKEHWDWRKKIKKFSTELQRWYEKNWISEDIRRLAAQ